MEDIDNSLQVLLRPHREREEDWIQLQLSKRLDRALEIGPLAVDPVDEGERGNPDRRDRAPHPLRADLGAPDCGDHEHGAVERLQGDLPVAQEAGSPGVSTRLRCLPSQSKV